MLKKFCLVLAAALLIVGSYSNVQAHSGDEMVAVYGTTPTIDGTISPGKWNDASTVNFSVTWYEYIVTVYIKQDGSNLYIAFNIPDPNVYPDYPEWSYDLCQVFLDVDHDGGTDPYTDDLLLEYERLPSPSLHEYHWNETGSGWRPPLTPDGWTAAYWEGGLEGYQVEYNISYSKIGVTPGVAKTLGVSFQTLDLFWDWDQHGEWPLGSWLNGPDTWADLTFQPQAWATTCSVWTTDDLDNPQVEFDPGESVWVHWIANGIVNMTVYSPDGVTIDKEWTYMPSSGAEVFTPSHGNGLYEIDCTGAKPKPIAIATFLVIPQLPFLGSLLTLVTMLGTVFITKKRSSH